MGKDLVCSGKCWIIELGEILALKKPQVLTMVNFIPKLKIGIETTSVLKVANLILGNQRVWDSGRVSHSSKWKTQKLFCILGVQIKLMMQWFGH